MRRDLLYRFHDQLAILETRTIALYRQSCAKDLGQDFLRTAHTLQHDLADLEKTAARSRGGPPDNYTLRRPRVAIHDDHQHLTWLRCRWPVARLHICRVVVSRVQSVAFRKLWHTSAVGCENILPCCGDCPIYTTENMSKSAVNAIDILRAVPLSECSSTMTLGVHGTLFMAAVCLKEELEELTKASRSLHSAPVQLETLKIASEWFSNARMLL